MMRLRKMKPYGQMPRQSHRDVLFARDCRGLTLVVINVVEGGMMRYRIVKDASLREPKEKMEDGNAI